MLGWMKHNLETRLPRETTITSNMQMTLPLWQKVKRNWKASSESERGEWKSWLKTQHSKNKDHGIWSHHFMANGWGNNGNGDRLYFLGLQDHCRWWLQPWNRHLLLGRKAMTNLDSILKSRVIFLPTKVHIVKAMVFPVVMYGCENWTLKKAEHQRIDAFGLWCWQRLLRVPWTARSF